MARSLAGMAVILCGAIVSLAALIQGINECRRGQQWHVMDQP